MKPNTFVRVTVALLFFWLVWTWPLQSQETDEVSPVQVTLVSDVDSIQPGQPFWVAIRLELEKPWHAYWKNPGDIGLPITVLWDLPLGFKVGKLKWPHPVREESSVGVSYFYEDDLWLMARVTPPRNLTLEETSAIKAKVRYLICSDEKCVPGKVKVRLNLLNQKESKPSELVKEFERLRESYPKLLEDIKVTRSADGTLALQLLHEKEGVCSAYFCPEKQGVIDEQYGLKVDPSSSHQLFLRVKEPTKQLKGTLVVQREGEATEAFDIEAPVLFTESADEQIALVLPGEETFSIPEPKLAGGVLWALVLAFAGGVILNLMPCVLPVISLKIFSFVKMAGQSRRHIFQHGLYFTLGVLISFWALAGVLLALRSYGQAVGWGFQLQEPIFVAALAGVLFLFALSLFGLFEFGTMFASWAGQVDQSQEESMTASLMSGVLATAVATPCTGPFLGSAIGFAVTQPAIWSLLIFTSLGVGMAAPYLLLSAFPSLLRFLPKPGVWMITFKEILGFCMIATTLWLLWVFGAQMGMMAVFAILGAFLFFAVGGWVYGKWGAPSRRRPVRVVGLVVALLFLCFGGYITYQSTQFTPSYDVNEIAAAEEGDSISAWKVFDPMEVKRLQEQGTPVLVDFTARWCLICQANHIILSTGDVKKSLNEMKVVRMQADWTKRSPMITRELSRYGRNSVPLYLLFPGDPNKEPIVLPQVLTPDVVQEALAQLQEDHEVELAEVE